MSVVCGAHLGRGGTSGLGSELLEVPGAGARTPLMVPGAGAGTPLPSSGTGSPDCLTAGLPGRWGRSRDVPGTVGTLRPGRREI